jgi:hypothetical protein
MTKIAIASIISSLIFVAGCGTVGLTAPDGYAKRKSWHYDYMAVSTDANVISLRLQENEDEEKGTLDFWTEATRKHLTLSRGYEAKDEGAFKTELGPGRYLVMVKEHKGVEHLYVVGLVVTGDTIYVMEGGGEKGAMETEVPKMVAAFGTLK